MNKVIVFHEKHMDYYYDASTDEALALSCASVLKDRVKDNYWYSEPEKPSTSLNEEDRAIHELTDEAVASLPVTIRTQVAAGREKIARRLARRESEYAQELNWWNRLQKLLTAEDLDEAAKMTWTTKYTRSTGEVKIRTQNLAWSLIQDRGDYEYEGYSIENLQEPRW